MGLEDAIEEVIETRLTNGLRVAISPDRAVPSVGIAVYYDVGSRNERPGTSGFAHLFEHMMFQGSAHVGKAEHFQLVQAWGGQLNGTTSQDRTNYWESLPADQLPLGLWLEADRMRSLAVTPENFENQRQTVMEERRQRVDNSAYGLASLRLGELSFGCWAYAHPVIGSWEDLRDARLQQVIDFHRTWYRPDNAVLALAGDLDPDAVMRQIQDWFGDIPAGGDRPAPDLVEPPRAGPVHEVMTDPLAKLPALMLNHQAPPFRHPDFFTWEVIETLLFRGSSSRVYRRLVIDERVAIQVSGGYEAHRGPSLFGLFAATSTVDDLQRVVDLYQDEVARFIAQPPTAAELQKARNQLHAARVMGRESVLNRALVLGRSALYFDDVRWEQRYMEHISAVTVEDLQRVAAAALTPDSRVILEVHPR